jgi:hypothetical protein
MRNRNVFTRLGRPPKTTIPKAAALASGEPQGASPMQGLDTAIPAAAFNRGGQTYGCKPMPKYHPDPGFCAGGSTKRR